MYSYPDNTYSDVHLSLSVTYDTSHKNIRKLISQNQILRIFLLKATRKL